jgi:hypothetical protein
MKGIRLAISLFAVALAAGCGRSSEASYTAVQCGKLKTAIEAQDTEAAQEVLATMADLGTEEDPHAVDPDVYARLLILQSATDAESFRYAMNDLLAVCAEQTA